MSRPRGVGINRLGKSINDGLALTAFLFLYFSEAELCGSANARVGCLWCGRRFWISAEMNARGSFANWVQ